MAENNENFSTMILHEARELRVRMFAGKTHLALTKKRFDEFGEMSDTGRQDMVIKGQHFTKLTQINWTRILFSLLGNNIAPRDVLVPLTANEDSVLLNVSRFPSNFVNEQVSINLII